MRHGMPGKAVDDALNHASLGRLGIWRFGEATELGDENSRRVEGYRSLGMAGNRNARCREDRLAEGFHGSFSYFPEIAHEPSPGAMDCHTAFFPHFGHCSVHEPERKRNGLSPAGRHSVQTGEPPVRSKMDSRVKGLDSDIPQPFLAAQFGNDEETIELLR